MITSLILSLTLFLGGFNASSVKVNNHNPEVITSAAQETTQSAEKDDVIQKW